MGEYEAMSSDSEVDHLEHEEGDKAEADPPGTRLELLPEGETDYSTYLDSIVNHLMASNAYDENNPLVSSHFQDHSRLGHIYTLTESGQQYLVIGRYGLYFILQARSSDTLFQMTSGEIVYLHYEHFLADFDCESTHDDDDVNDDESDDESDDEQEEDVSSDDESHSSTTQRVASRFSRRRQNLSPQGGTEELEDSEEDEWMFDETDDDDSSAERDNESDDDDSSGEFISLNHYSCLIILIY